MVNSLVLNEALSIPAIIDKFSIVDNNPYEDIARLINQNKINCLLSIQTVKSNPNNPQYIW